jgi:hypothetical protein
MTEVAHDQSYQFSAKPRAAPERGPYRDNQTINIMADRRVVRGNTYAALVLPRDDPAEVAKQREAQRRRLMRANATTKRPGTPEAVFGRKHTDIQTDSYLEELTERVVEFEAETQTDFLLDRPQSPLFLPAKVGVDFGTQVLHGELFDFDREVEPVLEVLVGKTLEHGMMEVLEEEELAAIRKRQALFEQTRHAELLDVQRMEAAEKRREEEKLRRLAQEKARAKEEFAAFKKAHSRATARNYLSGIGRKCLNLLESEGLFADKVQVAVETDFLPWLVSTVVSDIDAVRERQQLVDSTVVNMLKKLTIPHQKAIAKEADRRALIDSAERKMRETLDEKYRLLAMKSAREAEELAQLTAFDAERLPVVVPDGTPQIYVSLVSEGGEDGPASASLRVPDSEDTETVLIAEESGIVDTIKELSQDEGAVIICYVTGEGDDRRVTAAQLQEA